MEVAVPRLGEDLHVAVGVHVGGHAFVAPEAFEDEVLVPRPASAVGVLPDEPAALAVGS